MAGLPSGLVPLPGGMAGLPGGLVPLPGGLVPLPDGFAGFAGEVGFIPGGSFGFRPPESPDVLPLSDILFYHPKNFFFEVTGAKRLTRNL